MMRFLSCVLLTNLLTASMAQAAANCQHSHSWQCNHQAGNSGQQSQTSAGIGSAGNMPNTGNTNTPLGTVAPSQPLIQVNPLPQKVITGYGAVPQPQPIAVPPKQTVNVPPQNVYPTPPKVTTGYGAVPQPQPIAVPPKQTVNAPPQNVYPIPPKVTSGTGAVPKPQPTAIITHVDSSNLHPQVLLRQQALHSNYKFEEIEPMINNTQVDVYRGKDASRMIYQDTLPMDKRGFHLTVLGIKEPTFVDTAEPTESERLRSFTFYFDFASAEIKPQQEVLFSKIINEHQKTGKKIIIVGETDDFGSEEYNKHLAVHRSIKIIDELKSRGVEGNEVELRVLVRCCRTDHPTKESLAETRDQRITWVHFE